MLSVMQHVILGLLGICFIFCLLKNFSSKIRLEETRDFRMMDWIEQKYLKKKKRKA